MLSILIPAYNADKYIKDAILSASRQADETDLEILVCNDASTDNTAEIVRSLSHQIKSLRYFEQPENMGVSTARNRLLEELSPKSKYVAFLDADDLFFYNALQNSMELLHQNPKADYAFGKFQVVKSEFLNIHEPISDEWPIISGVTLSAGLYRTELIKKIDGFNTSLAQGEDLDFLIRIAEITRAQLTHDNTVFYYRRHDSNATKDARAMQSGLLRVLLLHALRRKKDATLFDAKGLFRYEGRKIMEKVMNVNG